MDRLSTEVIFAILGKTKVDNLLALSSVDREFRDLCRSKTLWKRIFRKHCLTMLKKSKSTSTWILNFRNSLSSASLTADIIARANSTDGILRFKTSTDMIPEVNLSLVGDASMIHIPKVTNKDKLEGLIMRSRLHSTKIFPCPLCQFLYPEAYRRIIGDKGDGERKPLYRLLLQEKQRAFFMIIRESCPMHQEQYEEHFRQQLTREQVCTLVYKLCYYSLLGRENVHVWLISRMPGGLNPTMSLYTPYV
ncbi:hypothetical protein BQ9231_00336 [Cedratvirus lausannensis]|uniref:F-box domain-containing protein n=1 Tax=Cedratvirus lausannensis TaxID=2023205 RepID=A0A285PX69_9VIRU|nr:hypothetical protein BQ9231_00336 [Cedratvirus lausannensis]